MAKKRATKARQKAVSRAVRSVSQPEARPDGLNVPDAIAQLAEGPPSSTFKAKPTKCFVIMPFGKKPMNDGTGRLYDFDKVYRVIIRRAIRQAGMEPIRADEKKGSNIIHTDMFKELRDQAVVLADLSLNNPNVFYELGVRHVLSSAGTVLICQAGSVLPFDVTLSRVIFYRYDGESLDWEEAESAVRDLQFALEEAKRGAPDSPVHALLHSVFRSNVASERTVLGEDAAGRLRSLDSYASMIARFWGEQGREPSDLEKEHGQTPFGARALGHFCLSKKELPPEAEHVAMILRAVEQYDLAIDVYAKLHARGDLSVVGLLSYSSAVNDEFTDGDQAEHALVLAEEAIRRVQQEPGGGEEASAETLEVLARCYQRLVGAYIRRWDVARDEADLERALENLTPCLEMMRKVRRAGRRFPIGMLAQAHLRRMIVQRIRDDDPDRADAERDREAILSLKGGASDHPLDLSYLRWFRAVTLADAGDSEATRRAVLGAFSEDAKIIHRPDCAEVGRRQYTRLRKFLEDHSSVFRHPSLIGHVSQVLQMGHR